MRWSTYIGTTTNDVISGITQTTNSVVLIGFFTSLTPTPLLTLVNPWSADSLNTKVFIADFVKNNGNARYVSYYGKITELEGSATPRVAFANFGGSLFITFNCNNVLDSMMNAPRNGMNGIVGKLFWNNFNQWQPLCSRYIGGNGNDYITDIAVYNNKVFITGYTNSAFNSSDSIAVNAVQNDLASPSVFDAFVTKMDFNLTNIEFSTYYGTEQEDKGLGVDVSAIMDYTDNSPVVVGYTLGENLPGRSQYYSIQYDYGGHGDAFIVKFYGLGGIYAKPIEENQSILINEAKNELFLYPNPAAEEIKIQINFKEETRISVQVCNILGEVLYSFEATRINRIFERSIDLTTFPPGFYFVRTFINGNINCFGFTKY